LKITRSSIRGLNENVARTAEEKYVCLIAKL
jgi:hypothetical protein